MSRRLQQIDKQIQQTLHDITSKVQHMLQDIRKHVETGEETKGKGAELDALPAMRLSRELARLSVVIESARAWLAAEMSHREETLARERRDLRKAWEDSRRQIRSLSFWAKVLVVATFVYVFLLGSLLWMWSKQADEMQERVHQPPVAERLVRPAQ